MTKEFCSYYLQSRLQSQKRYLNHKENHISSLIIVKNIVNQEKEWMALTLTHNLLTFKEVGQSSIVQIVKTLLHDFPTNLPESKFWLYMKIIQRGILLKGCQHCCKNVASVYRLYDKTSLTFNNNLHWRNQKNQYNNMDLIENPRWTHMLIQGQPFLLYSYHKQWFGIYL